MKITKFGQCCLLVEVSGKRILTDPGSFSTKQNDLAELDLILITHEHGDHLHTDSLKTIVEKNPNAVVVTNSSVGAILDEAGIAHTILEGEATTEIVGLFLEAYDGEHAEIFEDFGLVQNTGYFIDNYLFYPGDAYTEPGKEVPVLALPVSGPWCRITDAIHYALRVRPGTAFPVHDVFLNENGLSLVHNSVGARLEERDISFVSLKNDETIELPE